MATTNVTVPSASSPAYTGWIAEVSSILDAGNDVQFVDPDDHAVNVPYFILTTSGAVKARAKEQSTAYALTYVAGGWHRQDIGFIYADGTDAALGMHVMTG